MPDKYCMIFGVEDGIRFDCGERRFTLSLEQCQNLMATARHLLAGESSPGDDYTQEIFLTKTLLRYNEIRVPVLLKCLDIALYSAIQRHLALVSETERNLHARREVDKTMSEIAKELGLD